MAVLRCAQIPSATVCVAMVLAFAAASGCGGGTASRQDRRPAPVAAAAPADDAHAAAHDRLRNRDIPVFVDVLPSQPYLVITTFRYPAPSDAGGQVVGLKERARAEGGDAVLVRVVSGALGRTNTVDEPLIEARVIAWR